MTTVAAMPATAGAPAAKVSKVRLIARLCFALMIGTCSSMALELELDEPFCLPIVYFDIYLSEDWIHR